MRLGEYTKAMLDVIVEPKNQRNMQTFVAGGFQGGWEVWMQCQSFCSIPENARYRCVREAQYPGLPVKRCDYLIEGATGDPPRLWAELKVQLAQQDSISRLVRRFAKDVVKLKGLRQRLPDADNSAAAIAVAVDDVEDLLSERNRTLFHEVAGETSDRVRLYSDVTGKSGGGTPWRGASPIKNGQIVLLVYSLYP